MKQYHLLLAVAIVLPVAGIVWSLTASRMAPADFTFNNATEIKTIDPALVNGQPEGRIVNSLFEGLVRLDPEHRLPVTGGAEEWPGVAERWEISDDQLTYTFYLRKDAKWSNGDPVTAEDYHYSLRRFLHPLTAAEFGKQGWYLENGKKFNAGGTYLEPGDRVEIELNLRPGQHDTQQGEILSGKLIRKDPPTLPEDQKERDRITQRFYVEIDGAERCFVMKGPGEAAPPDTERCRQVTLAFSEVGVKVIDPYTIEMKLKGPTPFWLQLMGFYPLYPVHRGCLEEHGAPAWTRPENIVTNGPYTISFRRPRDRIRLVKNPHYWNRDNVRLEVIDALSIEDMTTSLNLYERGGVDWITDPPNNVMQELMNADPPRPDFNPSTMAGTYYYKFNVKRGALADKRVRQALSLALDREEIIRTAVRGPQQPAFHLVPPGMPGYTSPEWAQQDVEKAQQLLSDAGYPQGKGFKPIEIIYNTHEAHKAVAELVARQWQQNLGITVTLKNAAWPAYQDALRMMQYDVGRQAWIADYIDPNSFIDLFVSDNENNQTGWANAEYDRLVEEAEVEEDVEKRLQLMYQAEEILTDEMPLVPIYFYYSKNLVRPHVRGFYNNLQDMHPLHALWIDDNPTAPNEFMKGGAK